MLGFTHISEIGFSPKEWSKREIFKRGSWLKWIQNQIKKTNFKAKRHKHFNCGSKYGNTLLCRLRLGRSFLKAYVFPEQVVFPSRWATTLLNSSGKFFLSSKLLVRWLFLFLFSFLLYKYFLIIYLFLFFLNIVFYNIATSCSCCFFSLLFFFSFFFLRMLFPLSF